MNLKNFINNYNDNKKAFNKLKIIKKMINRYNDNTLYNIFSLLIVFSFSILITFFLSPTTLSEYFFFYILLNFILFLIIFGIISFSSGVISLYILEEKIKIDKLLTKMFNPFILFNKRKTIKLNNKIKQIKNIDKENILEIIKIKSEVKKYRYKKHKKNFPEEKSNYNKEEYEKSLNLCSKEIEIIDILEYLLINSNIEYIKTLNFELKQVISQFTLLEQKRILDIINEKLTKENIKINNEKELKKYNNSILDNLTNSKNKKIIREL